MSLLCAAFLLFNALDDEGAPVLLPTVLVMQDEDFG